MGGPEKDGSLRRHSARLLIVIAIIGWFFGKTFDNWLCACRKNVFAFENCFEPKDWIPFLRNSTGSFDFGNSSRKFCLYVRKFTRRFVATLFMNSLIGSEILNNQWSDFVRL